jgi:hypothetical protein
MARESNDRARPIRVRPVHSLVTPRSPIARGRAPARRAYARVPRVNGGRLWSSSSSAVIIGLVALQCAQGVDRETAIERALAVWQRQLSTGSDSMEQATLVALMRSVDPAAW